MATTGDPTAEARRFDWQGAHARLERALEKLEAAANPSPARIRQVLRERAQRYASKRRAEAAETFTEVIGFSIGEDRFAIEIGHGAAVTPLTNLTSLPGIPSFYLGLISHRVPPRDPRPHSRASPRPAPHVTVRRTRSRPSHRSRRDTPATTDDRRCLEC